MTASFHCANENGRRNAAHLQLGSTTTPGKVVGWAMRDPVVTWQRGTEAEYFDSAAACSCCIIAHSTVRGILGRRGG